MWETGAEADSNSSDMRKQKPGASRCCRAGRLVPSRWGDTTGDQLSGRSYELSLGRGLGGRGLCQRCAFSERGQGVERVRQRLGCNPIRREGGGRGKSKKRGQRLQGMDNYGVKATEGVCGQTRGRTRRVIKWEAEMEATSGRGWSVLAKPRSRHPHGSGSEAGAEMSQEDRISGSREARVGEGRASSERAQSSPARTGLSARSGWGAGEREGGEVGTVPAGCPGLHADPSLSHEASESLEGGFWQRLSSKLFFSNCKPQITHNLPAKPL